MFYQQLQLTASGSAVKALPAVQNKRVQPLGGEDPLEKGMAVHSSILVHGKSHGQRSLVGYRPSGLSIRQDLTTKQEQLFTAGGFRASDSPQT